jgi:methionine-R-sulfoxide reductase
MRWISLPEGGCMKMNNQTASQMTEDDWKQKLTPEQYHVLREKGTEVPGTGKLLHNNDKGEYTCAACGAVLFRSDDKYESTVPGLIGWPSFANVAHDTDGQELVILQDNNSLGMHRLEAVCRNCGSHLGHLFPDESSHTGKHYCINSCALDFKEG